MRAVQAAAVLALLLGPCGARAASSEQSAVLWIPPAGYARWAETFALLDRFPRARITLALSPDGVPPEARAVLAEKVKKGRLELALRLEGDPWLPLALRGHSGDVGERLASAKAKHRAAFGKAPDGFVATGGALDIATARLLASMRFAWTAVSDAGGADAWAVSDRMSAVPFRVIAATEPFKAKPGEPPRAILLDEAAGPLPEGAALKIIEELFDTGMFEGSIQERWAEVSEAFPPHGAPAAPPSASWPAWAKPEGGELGARAEGLYVQAATALAGYQNSGLARLEALDAASASLHEAQAWRFHRPGGLTDPAAGKEYRRHLRAVFKAIGQPAPDSLLAPLSTAGSVEDEERAARVGRGASAASLWFENPVKSLSFAPKELPAGTPKDAWSLRRLGVGWDKSEVRFSIVLGRLPDLQAAKASGPLVHLYIDVNRLAGRGATRLLPGTDGFLRSIDGWEYALEVDAFGAQLWRSSPSGPAPVGAFPVRIDPKRSELAVAVPRQQLRGDPARWGYLLLALAADAAPVGSPRAFKIGQNGSPVLGLLGDLEEQKLLEDPLSPIRRFSALRLEKGL